MFLGEAASVGDVSRIKELLARGVKDYKDLGSTALMSAAYNGHKEAIKVLLAAGPPNINEKDNDGVTALMFAAEKGYKEIISLLLAAGAKVDERDDYVSGWTALTKAASEGHQEGVKILLAAGAKVNGKGYCGNTALVCAASGGHKEVIEILLAAGAKVNEKSESGSTALMSAALGGYKEVIKVLLAAGAKVNEMSKSGTTALMCAAEQGHKEAVEVLLAAGAKVDEKRGRDDRTALMSAASRGHKEVIEILLAAGAKVNEKGFKSETALMSASMEGHNEIIEVLLAAGARVNEENDLGTTALMCAAEKGHREAIEVLLAAAGAKVNEKDKGDWSALMFAVQNGHKETVRVLLAAGAKVDERNGEGITALDIARRGKQFEIVALLEEAAKKPLGLDAQELNQERLGSMKPAAGGAGAPVAVRGVDEEELNQERLQSIKPVKGGSGGAASGTSHYKVIPFDSLEFTGKTLGAGGFGVVKAATWSFMDVAVKQLKVSRLSDESLAEFEAEAKIHAGLNHLNIVRLYGACIESFKYCMVMELMVGGSLYDVLHSAKEMPWEIRSSIAKDIAVGLTYLHEHGILHRDLKSLNVLLDDRMRAKLSDFGLSKVKTETMASTAASEKGTLCWMAPELFKRGAKHNELSDIYALGMVLWELASREIPFNDSHGNSALLMQWVKDGERDEIPATTPPKLAMLIGQCWAQNPTDRPKSAREVAEALVKS
jgi:ankyrin repeat protein